MEIIKNFASQPVGILLIKLLLLILPTLIVSIALAPVSKWATNRFDNGDRSFGIIALSFVVAAILGVAIFGSFWLVSQQEIVQAIANIF